ncbi:MAG: hypothetical protein R3C44_02390 [Chloroflexota bacterium]
MPKASVNGIDINYQVQGSGDPLILIGGLGADMFLWFRQIPELSRHFQVIAYDSREPVSPVSRMNPIPLKCLLRIRPG